MNIDFLAPNLTFFGDNAYVSTEFMATPYKGSQQGCKDAYNFFQSQLRINIECAFGMLVHRWGVLHKPLPVNITVSKATQLVRALCIFHNFCIDEKEPIASLPSSEDVLTGMISGGFAHDDAGSRPELLMDNGHHFDDYVSANNQRNIRRRQQRTTDFPRERLLAHITDMGIKSFMGSLKMNPMFHSRMRRNLIDGRMKAIAKHELPENSWSVEPFKLS
jgi:hypothetical protein